MKLFVGFAAFALAAIAATSAVAAAVSDDLAVQRAIERGRLIYAYDQAAWYSTDELLKQIPDPQAAGVSGYVVEPRGNQLHVVYYKSDKAGTAAVFSAEMDGRTVTASHLFATGENAALTPVEIEMINARNYARAAANRSRTGPCVAAPFNSVVLPPVKLFDPVTVYLLTPQVKAGEYPAGGHYEYEISVSGDILSTRPFTRSCITLGGQPSKPGMKPVASFITHLLDPTPTEIHVYLSLWMGQPLYVGTQSPTGETRVWAVEGDHIRLINPASAK